MLCTRANVNLFYNLVKLSYLFVEKVNSFHKEALGSRTSEK